MCLLDTSCNSQPPTKEVIEQQALDAIDFDKLEPSIREFIELAQANNVIGRSIKEFNSILAFELSGIQHHDEINKLTVYYFVLAMTKEALIENNAVASNESGVLQFPFLSIFVDDTTQEITQSRIYIQGLGYSRVDQGSTNMSWF